MKHDYRQQPCEAWHKDSYSKYRRDKGVLKSDACYWPKEHRTSRQTELDSTFSAESVQPSICLTGHKQPSQVRQGPHTLMIKAMAASCTPEVAIHPKSRYPAGRIAYHSWHQAKFKHVMARVARDGEAVCRMRTEALQPCASSDASASLHVCAKHSRCSMHGAGCVGFQIQ